VDPDCKHPEYLLGKTEGDARLKVFFESTEDHTDIPPIGRVICGANERPIPLALPVNVHHLRPAARRLIPHFLDEGEFDTREVQLIDARASFASYRSVFSTFSRFFRKN
jgi:hypothetical protein